MSANAQNTNIPANAEQTTVMTSRRAVSTART